MNGRRIIAINGSPRKDKNTAVLVEKALEGIRSKGVHAELIHIFELEHKGCRSCFNCKLLGGKSFAKCSIHDGLTPVLKMIRESDGLIIGTPVYFGSATAVVRALIERLYFPLYAYNGEGSLFYRQIPTGFIFTLDQKEDEVKALSDYSHLVDIAGYAERLTGPAKVLFAYDTNQFEDYSKYVVDNRLGEAKKQSHEINFPEYCRQALIMGQEIAAGIE